MFVNAYEQLGKLFNHVIPVKSMSRIFLNRLSFFAFNLEASFSFASSPQLNTCQPPLCWPVEILKTSFELKVMKVTHCSPKTNPAAQIKLLLLTSAGTGGPDGNHGGKRGDKRISHLLQK